MKASLSTSKLLPFTVTKIYIFSGMENPKFECFVGVSKVAIKATDNRVTTDLENLKSLGKSENLKETFESQGICLKSQGIYDRIPKVREKSGNFVA